MKTKHKRWWAFNRARKYIRNLNILSTTEWHEWLKSGDRPIYIPANPTFVYKEDGWVSMRDWLGNTFLSYDKARRYIIDFEGIKTSTEYKVWCRTDARPVTIPSSPSTVYADNWQGWEHFLGTEGDKKKYCSFAQARVFVHKLGINNQQEWFEWCRSDARPDDIPTNPHYVYKDKGWEGWRNFIGPNNKWLAYEDAKVLIQGEAFCNATEYRAWFTQNRIADWRSRKRKQKMPSNPVKAYKDRWKDWNHFLSHTPVTKFMSFKEAREFARSSDAKTYDQWRDLCRDGGKPDTIPANPYAYYDAFISWPNFLGKRSKRRKHQRV